MYLLTKLNNSNQTSFTAQSLNVSSVIQHLYCFIKPSRIQCKHSAKPKVDEIRHINTSTENL